MSAASSELVLAAKSPLSLRQFLVRAMIVVASVWLASMPLVIAVMSVKQTGDSVQSTTQDGVQKLEQVQSSLQAAKPVLDQFGNVAPQLPAFEQNLDFLIKMLKHMPPGALAELARGFPH